MPRRNQRCTFSDDGDRCRRYGFGSPALCRHHLLLVAAELDRRDPLAELLGTVDRFVSQRTDLREGGALVGALLARFARGRSTAAPAPARRGPVPTSAPPPKPAPERDPAAAERAARMILGFEPDATIDPAAVKTRRRDLAALYHPDKPGGSPNAMRRVNQAADLLLRRLS